MLISSGFTETQEITIYFGQLFIQDSKTVKKNNNNKEKKKKRELKYPRNYQNTSVLLYIQTYM